ncbi:MAG: hypothetical protein KDC84_14960 [Crocinitomicaceae bacterium]|nr:hypothetical protein [Crocinitomicaceae bacterium]
MNKRLAYIIITVTVILLVPAIAMQFSDEVNWTTFDFIMAAIVLYGFGFLFEIAARKIKDNKKKIFFYSILLLLLILLYAEMAVGIFGTPLAGS